MNNRDSGRMPIGKIVECTWQFRIPEKIYSGEYVSLKPVEAEKDVDALFQNSH